MHAVTDNQSRDPMDEPAGARLPNPQVRTLLLTDLCDSTMLVERLGDNAAAELFRAHDRLVLQLQQQWRGRLIDRSDGLLLLFERAIDGLGFALDYARGLRELGERAEVTKAGVELRARAGLHVGEVLTWRNSDAAVNVGAKPLEVEGLAKPMAGRLMTLARPGQILLSATAEPLAHRAARELGERGETLLWKSHGRWRFKGVPQAQEVYEVGEPGITPLRAPQQNRAKAWRDIPLWRRPAALAAELLLVAGLAGGSWFLTRPQPAIAFGERDWVVVGDLRNLTGDKLLDESLEQAFRISLEQSRYVNVLSDLKARDTLERMRRKPDTVLDRAVSSEIALRDGARAVILPTVAEIGGRVRVSAEVIDPHTQTTVYAESADGSGVQSTLHSIDKVTAALRGKLGEALQSIQRNSVSLPNVTTSNLDALKAYALGRKYSAEGDGKQAIAYYQRAVRLDPEFALAHMDTGMVYITKLGDIPSGKRELQLAMQLRGRLGPREASLLDASLARLGPPGPAIQQWRQLVEIYPDQLGAQLVLGQMELWDQNNASLALLHARLAAAPQAEQQGTAHYLQGIVLVALDKPQQAIEAFGMSSRLGYHGAVFSHAYAYAMRRDWDGVTRVLAGRKPTGMDSGEVQVPEQLAVFAVDQGRWNEALEHAQAAVDAAEKAEPELQGPMQRVRQLSIEVLTGRASTDESARRIREAMDDVVRNAAHYDALDPGFRVSLLHALGYVAARIDDRETVARAVALADQFEDTQAYPILQQMQVVLHAELERIDHRQGPWTERLRKLARSDLAIVPVHSALLRAEALAGNHEGVEAQARWLESHRGRAYVERSAWDLLLAVNVADTTIALLDRAETSMRSGNLQQAGQLRNRLASIWKPDRMPASIKRRWDALPLSPP